MELSQPFMRCDKSKNDSANKSRGEEGVTYHHVDPVIVSHTIVRIRAHLNPNGHDAVHLTILKLEENGRQKVYWTENQQGHMP